MFKFLVFTVVLWQATGEIVNQSEAGTTDTKLSSLPMNGFPKHMDPRLLAAPYGFYATNQMLNFPSPFPWKNPLGWGGSSGIELNSDYLVTYGIGAHKIHVRKLPWNKARRTCTDEGGHLAVIRSDSEEKIITQMMHDNSIDDAWVGIHDMFDEGDWVTVLDEPLGASGWARWSNKFKPNPDNYQGTQHCARFVRDSDGMDDATCTLAKPFICKISPI